MSRRRARRPWYARLGSIKEWEHQFEAGLPWFISVARGNVRLYLSEHKCDARPDTLIHLYVKDIDAMAEEFGIPVDEDGVAGRECALVDPDGNRLRVATRRSWMRALLASMQRRASTASPPGSRRAHMPAAPPSATPSPAR
jgi:Glyoxalase superfamily protein